MVEIVLLFVQVRLAIRDRLVLGQRLLLAVAAHFIDRDIASDHDQPCRRIARRTVLRPALQRTQAGVLEGFLGGIEIAEITQQRADRLGTRQVSAPSIQAVSVTSECSQA